ncbi:MAG: ATP-binding protein [Eubacteriales bacterium]|nr:ATP-binding protein [Eubacteriales bacterium]
MSLQNFQYEAIMRQYNQKQARNRQNFEKRTEEVYAKLPRLSEIDGEIASLYADRIRSKLTHTHFNKQQFDLELDLLKQERKALLNTLGLTEDYLEETYDCPLCHDTGYVGHEKCSCFKKAEIELLYTQSQLSDILKEENFDHFSFDYYSATMKNEITGLTALETAHRAYDQVQNFVETFDISFQNLFIYGNTGVGKTFLSHCAAERLLNRSHSVLYFSSFEIFDLLAQKAFHHSSELDNEYIFNCDLLIIDDLGTELTNSFVSSQLFLCINERILRKKSTIISTNLELAEFSAIYSERTLSRIASNYQMIKLFGDDIRLQKKFIGGN